MSLLQQAIEKLKVLKRPVGDDDIAGKRIIAAKKILLWLGSFSSSYYHPLKKLSGRSSSCKVGLGIILGSPSADNFGINKKKEVIITSNFSNNNKPLRSSSSIGTMMIESPNNNPSSMLFLGDCESFKNSSSPINAAANDDYIEGHGQGDHHPVVIKSMSSNYYNNYYIQDEWRCVFAVESIIMSNGSKKLAICRKHRNTGFLSLEDIETTDNYSRKINYLPNLKVITHMYNYCILEFPQIQPSNNNDNFNHQFPLYPPPSNLPSCRRYWPCSSDNEYINFLKTCETCDKLLEGQDIYIYRGELSFCSPECRYWKVKSEKELEKVTGMVPAAMATVASDNMEPIFYLSTNYKPSVAGV